MQGGVVGVAECVMVLGSNVAVGVATDLLLQVVRGLGADDVHPLFRTVVPSIGVALAQDLEADVLVELMGLLHALADSDVAAMVLGAIDQAPGFLDTLDGLQEHRDERVYAAAVRLLELYEDD